MLKLFKILAIAQLAITIVTSNAYSAETHYVNATIERVESCSTGAAGNGVIFIFISNATGKIPTLSNGCSNDVSLPYLRINTTNGELSKFENTFLTIALSAKMNNSAVRIRYTTSDDRSNTNNVVSIALL